MEKGKGWHGDSKGHREARMKGCTQSMKFSANDMDESKMKSSTNKKYNSLSGMMPKNKWVRNYKSNYEYRWDKGTNVVTLRKGHPSGIWLAEQSDSVGGFRELGKSVNFKTAESYAKSYMKRT